MQKKALSALALALVPIVFLLLMAPQASFGGSTSFCATHPDHWKCQPSPPSSTSSSVTQTTTSPVPTQPPSTAPTTTTTTATTTAPTTTTTTAPTTTSSTAPVTHPSKLLVIVEENHSYSQMQSGMPYLWSLATTYGYATNYTAISHPSLPNYLAIAGGSTFGITDDNNPSAHPINAPSVFDQALAANETAGVYADSMPSACDLTNAGTYAVRHNPWTYFVPGRTDCQRYDVPEPSFLTAAQNNQLPNSGMVIPDVCNDAHSCSLATADSWLQARIPTVLASSDFTSGQLAVVITTDEDDRSSGNHVLTAVLDVNLSGTVVTTPLDHYSLSRFYSDTVGAAPLANAQNATDMRAAFGL